MKISLISLVFRNMREMKYPYSFIFDPKLIFILLLLAVDPVVLADNAGYPSDIISGEWKMVANGIYYFDLNINRNGSQITGTMTNKNGEEPMDIISGIVSQSGKIEFTRARPGAWTQVYSGYISGSSNDLFMEGTFTHNGVGQYPWNASFNKEKHINLSHLIEIYKKRSGGDVQPTSTTAISWDAVQQLRFDKFGLLRLVSMDYVDGSSEFIDWNQPDLRRMFKWNSNDKRVASVVWQVSILPFPDSTKNWENPPGLVASGAFNADKKEFGIDFSQFSPRKQEVNQYWMKTKPYLTFKKKTLESIKDEISNDLAKTAPPSETVRLNQLLVRADVAIDKVDADLVAASIKTNMSMPSSQKPIYIPRNLTLSPEINKSIVGLAINSSLERQKWVNLLARVNPQYNVTGLWKMVAKVQYRFDLNLHQSGYQIEGSMMLTNGQEPTDKVSGKIYAEGNVEFIRIRPGEWTQTYTGKVSGTGKDLTMEGTFTHNGEGKYPWKATLGQSNSILKIKSDAKPLLLNMPMPSPTPQMIKNATEHWLQNLNSQAIKDATVRLLPQERRTYFVRVVALDVQGKCIGLPSKEKEVLVGEPELSSFVGESEIWISDVGNKDSISFAAEIPSSWTRPGHGARQGLDTDLCMPWTNSAISNWCLAWNCSSKNISHAIWQVATQPSENLPGTDESKTWINPPGLVASGTLRADEQDPDIKMMDRIFHVAKVHLFSIDFSKFAPAPDLNNPINLAYYVRVVAVEPTNQPGQYVGYPSKWIKITYGPCEVEHMEVYNPPVVEKKIPGLDVKILTYQPIQNADKYWFYHYIVTKCPDWPMACDMLPPGSKMDLTPQPEDKSWYDYIGDFFESVVSFIEDVVNFVSNTWNDIKSACVSVVANAACFGNSECSEILTEPISMGLDIGLAAMGIPPEIPNFDKLSSMGAEYLTKVIISEVGVDPDLAGLVSYDDVKAGVNAFVDASGETLPGDPFGLQLDPDFQYRPAYMQIQLTNNQDEDTLPGTLHIRDSNHLFKEIKDAKIPPMHPGETLTIPVFLKEFMYESIIYTNFERTLLLGTPTDPHDYTSILEVGPNGEFSYVDWRNIYHTREDTFTVYADTYDYDKIEKQIELELGWSHGEYILKSTHEGDSKKTLAIVPDMAYNA